MLQGTDANLKAHFARQEELSSYIGKVTYDVLHVIDFPPGLDNTFIKITEMFNATSGPFALIKQEGRSTTEFYASCFNDVRMAICAAWYNMSTFENLCRELEERVEEVAKIHKINSQLHMSIGSSAQRLCFEYEHFMFHQKMTSDRMSYYLSSFFKQQQGNIFALRKHVIRQYTNRADHPKYRYALAVDAVVSRHQSFLNSIHSSTQGRGQTERDILSHTSFIPFVNPYVLITPPGKVSVVFQATLDKKTVVPESARAILYGRYNQIAEFTKDMLNTFFDA
jgi:hypothetical protein